MTILEQPPLDTWQHPIETTGNHRAAQRLAAFEQSDLAARRQRLCKNIAACAITGAAAALAWAGKDTSMALPALGGAEVIGLGMTSYRFTEWLGRTMQHAQLAYDAESEAVQNGLATILPVLDPAYEPGEAVAVFRSELLADTRPKRGRPADERDKSRKLYNLLEPLRPEREWRYGLALTLQAAGRSSNTVWRQTVFERLDRVCPLTAGNEKVETYDRSAVECPQSWQAFYDDLAKDTARIDEIMHMPVPDMLGREV